jgi:hypothetical protein
MRFSLCYQDFISPLYHFGKCDVYFIHNDLSLFLSASLYFIDPDPLSVVNHCMLWTKYSCWLQSKPLYLT